MTINMRIKKDEKNVKARSRKSRRNLKNLISTSPSEGTREPGRSHLHPSKTMSNRLKGSKVGFENDAKLAVKREGQAKVSHSVPGRDQHANICRRNELINRHLCKEDLSPCFQPHHPRHFKSTSNNFLCL